MNRRRFMAKVASAGLAAPLLWRDSLAEAQTGPAPPTNVRLVSSPPPSSSGSNPGNFLGGWRLSTSVVPQEGPIAIDFSRSKLWIATMGRVDEYDLPPMQTGSISAWPRLTPTRTIPRWWPSFSGEGANTYPNGLVFWQGKLWVAPRVFYTNAPSSTMAIYAQDGETHTVNLPRQVFAGFVKRGPGLEPLLGCGGYESGQGSTCGPSLATLNGQALIRPAAFNAPWDQRAPREPNYSTTEPDGWLAMAPRLVNGVLEGRWASDVIFGGGLVLPEGITFWPWMGTGDIDYARQRITFAALGMERTYRYRYDPNTYQLTDFVAAPELHNYPVFGQELGPDGKTYLTTWWTAWQSPDAAIHVYG